MIMVISVTLINHIKIRMLVTKILLMIMTLNTIEKGRNMRKRTRGMTEKERNVEILGNFGNILYFLCM